jgi:signal peptidase I
VNEFVLSKEGFQELMAAVLKADPNFRVKIRGRGYSMIPFIKDQGDILLRAVDPAQGIKFGDIVAVSNRGSGKIVVHRVIRSKGGRYQTKGDNNPYVDNWSDAKDIIAQANEIRQKLGWFYYTGIRWQNILIAMASRTGILNRVLYPGYLYLRNRVNECRIVTT